MGLPLNLLFLLCSELWEGHRAPRLPLSCSRWSPDCVLFGLSAHFLQYSQVGLPNSLTLSSFSPVSALFFSINTSHCAADKVNDDFYAKRRHLAELAAKGNLPLHPVRVEDESRAFSPEHGPAQQNGQKSRTNKMPPHPLAYNSTANFKTWDPSDQSLRRQAYGTKGKLGIAESGSCDPLGTRTQHFPPTQPYFITNSKTEVTVWAFTSGSTLESTLNWERQKNTIPPTASWSCTPPRPTPQQTHTLRSTGTNHRPTRDKESCFPWAMPNMLLQAAEWDRSTDFQQYRGELSTSGPDCGGSFPFPSTENWNPL